MVISTKGRYALRLMIDLAQHCDEGFISLKTVSQRQDVSLKYMVMDNYLSGVSVQDLLDGKA